MLKPENVPRKVDGTAEAVDAVAVNKADDASFKKIVTGLQAK